MNGHFIVSDYVAEAMGAASYDKLEDVSFGGRIASCAGVVASGTTLRACEDELRSTLEDWSLAGLKLGHPLPILAGIDLNTEPQREPVDAL